jgi:hypothetical protein
MGWLLLVVAAVVTGQRLGTDNLSYDPGQAGQAERVLGPARYAVARHRGRPHPGSHPRPDLRSESGVQAGGPGGSGGAASVAAGRDRDPVAAEQPGLISDRSALVAFNVAGNPDNDDQAVVPAMNAVAAIQG